VDSVPQSRRSEIMARVRSKNTKAEMLVRRLVFALGYRYRLHVKTLPGHPDLVFRSRKKVIFVHGCFWHRHPGCPLARMPKSRVDFWGPKLTGNKERDIRINAQLVRDGWGVLTIWECQLGETDVLRTEIEGFLDA
jgi:DNA mismatch endonuclease (patch repair protein)